MKVLTILKFWKSNSNTASKVDARTTAYDGDSSETAINSTISDHPTEESHNDSDDDSYFELELTLPSHGSKNGEKVREKCEPKLLKWSNSKPQSQVPIIPGASPKLRVFMFGRFARGNNKKSLKRNRRVEDFSETGSDSFSPKRISKDSSFTVKFKIKDGSIVPKFTRRRSSSSTVSTRPKIENQNADESNETSKLFQKDTIQKYLKLVRPKSSKEYNHREKFGSFSPMRSSTTPFLPLKEKEEKQRSRLKLKCKLLVRSKSASAMIGVSSPVIFPVRNDLPADGIEGAILHCKRSLFSSSTEGYSLLSRCSSHPIHQKSIEMLEVI